MLAAAPLALAALPAVAHAAPMVSTIVDTPAAPFDAGAVRAAAYDAVLRELHGLQAVASEVDGRAFGHLWAYGLLGLAHDRDAAIAEHGEPARAVWQAVLDDYLHATRRAIEELDARHAAATA